jgi:hypothetical protein
MRKLFNLFFAIIFADSEYLFVFEVAPGDSGTKVDLPSDYS